MDSVRPTSECNVKLIGQTVYDDHAVAEWCQERGVDFTTDATGDADALSEFAGRVCYMSFNPDKRRVAGDGQNAAYLDHIRSVGHGSVSEHSVFNFLIDDVSRNMTHELVRHRVGVAYSQLSTRYVDQFSDEYFGDSGHTIGVYIPPELPDDLQGSWIAHWTESVFPLYREAFRRLRDSGIEKKAARSIARHILPGSACTALVFSVNVRELNHIFSLRGNRHADPEIRRMVHKIYELVKTLNVFSHWSLEYTGGVSEAHRVLELVNRPKELESK